MYLLLAIVLLKFHSLCQVTPYSETLVLVGEAKVEAALKVTFDSSS